MDSAIVSAMAAVLGTLVGGSATVATAWITQKTTSKRELVQDEMHKRETLYGEFTASIPSFGKAMHSTLLMFCSGRTAAGPPMEPR
jgi:hypothetical protein